MSLKVNRVGLSLRRHLPVLPDESTPIPCLKRAPPMDIAPFARPGTGLHLFGQLRGAVAYGRADRTSKAQGSDDLQRCRRPLRRRSIGLLGPIWPANRRTAP